MKFDIVSVPTFVSSDYKVSRPRLDRIANVETVPAYDEEPLVERMKNADGLLLFAHFPFTEKTIGKMTKCKGIVKVAVGYDNIDLKATGQKGIIVSNVPDYSVEDVADHAIALMLAQTRKIVVCDRDMRKGNWDWKVGIPCVRHRDKTLGVIGLGRIGRAAATRGKALGMNVIEHDPYIRPGEEKAVGVKAVDLDTLLSESDVITLHVNLTPETRHMIGEKELRKMKKTAYLVNTCRGPVVDPAALYKALSEKWIAGAALDVFEKEPADMSDKLFKLDNFISTPHIAWYSEDSFEELIEKANDEMIRILEGKPPRYQVNSAYFKK